MSFELSITVIAERGVMFHTMALNAALHFNMLHLDALEEL
jgi:hypothetical protein